MTMTIGIIGRKAGMSRLFTEDGRSIPVTLIEASANRITQIKTDETDGYSAVQVTAGSKRAALVTKPLAGHYAKAKVEAGRGLWEFRVDAKDLGNFQVGGEIKADIFSVGQIVDVAGRDQGQGLPGHDQALELQDGRRHPRQLAVASLAGLHRPAPDAGSRVPGQEDVRPHGRRATRARRTCEVVKVDAERGLIAIKGAVPGAPGGNVIVRPGTKG